MTDCYDLFAASEGVCLHKSGYEQRNINDWLGLLWLRINILFVLQRVFPSTSHPLFLINTGQIALF